MLTLQTVIDRAFGANSLSSYDLDPFTVDTLSAMSDQQKIDMVNWAMTDLGARIHMFQVDLEVTLVVGSPGYYLNDTNVFAKRITKPLYACVNGLPLYDASRRRNGIWSLAEIDRLRRQWRLDPAGTPDKLVWSGGDQVFYHATPDQGTIDGGNNLITGECLPSIATLDDLAVEIDIAEELQPYVPMYSALLAAMGTADEDNAWKRLATYDKKVIEIVDRVTQKNVNAQASFASIESFDAGYLYL